MSGKRISPLGIGQISLGIAGGFALYLAPRDAQRSLQTGPQEIFFIIGVALAVGLSLLWLKRYETVSLAVSVNVGLFLFNLGFTWLSRVIEAPDASPFVLSYTDALAWGLMWLIPVALCVLVRLFALEGWNSPEKRAQFARFFKISGIAFFIYYAVVLLLCFGLLRGANPSGERVINFIPFAQLTTYFSAQDPQGLLYFAGNLFILAPIGFYVSVLRPGWPWWRRLLFSAAFSAAMELLQLALNSGVVDIDDLLLNTVGVAIGIGLKGAIDLIRFRRTKGEEKSIFSQETGKGQ